MTTVVHWVYRLALLVAIGAGIHVGQMDGIDSGVAAFLIGLVITSAAAFVFEISLRATDRIFRSIGL